MCSMLNTVQNSLILQHMNDSTCYLAFFFSIPFLPTQVTVSDFLQGFFAGQFCS